MPKKRMVIAASGYFNPLHVGHLKYLEEAKRLGDRLVVIVNSDYQVQLKGSVPFMREDDRLKIIKALRCVDDAIIAIDKDGTVKKSIEFLKPDVFAKGGDRTAGNTPECGICDRLGIEIIFGVGGEKIRASSELIKKVGSAFQK